MNNQFDELAKGLAQSVTRRGALKKFGIGLAGIALASLGLAKKAEAAKRPECVHWGCVVSKNSKFPEYIDLYVCGGHPHNPDWHCSKLGVVPCGYCDSCC